LSYKRKPPMSKTYRRYEPDQMFLMPPSLLEWLPKDHLVFFLRDVLKSIDLSPITSVYEDESRGYPPYHPSMMTGVLLYGYCNGVRSSRKIAKHCQEDVAFRILAANNTPDFRTISDFRKRHRETLQHLFTEILLLCEKAGLVKFGHISLDGTKIKANASKHKAMSYGRMKQEIVRLKDEVAQLLQEAEAIDAEEDTLYGHTRRGDELPEELARRETRLAKIREAKRALEEEARQDKDDTEGSPQARIKTETDPKTGKERVADDAQRNFTDPESRILPYQKTFVQGYNAQLLVDKEHQIIVATDVSNTSTDDVQLQHMLTLLPRRPKVFTADAGYGKDHCLKLLRRKRINAFVALKREPHGAVPIKGPRGRIPKHITLRERMHRKLSTLNGRRTYALRKTIVEPVIGQIKNVMGFREFSLRGQDNTRNEWFLVTGAHNLLKLFRACTTKPRRRKLIFAT
jgi:transposase